MHPVIYLNKSMVEATKARVLVSSALLYGRGIFTNVAIYGGRPFLWSKHWSRLQEHGERVRVDLSGCTERGVGEALRKLISVNRVSEGRARVVFMVRNGRDYWKASSSEDGSPCKIFASLARRQQKWVIYAKYALQQS